MLPKQPTRQEQQKLQQLRNVQPSGGGVRLPVSRRRSMALQPTYWNAQNTAIYNSALRSRPIGTIVSDWVDEQALNAAYRQYQASNGRQPNDLWNDIPDANERAWLASMKPPPPDVQWESQRSIQNDIFAATSQAGRPLTFDEFQSLRLGRPFSSAAPSLGGMNPGGMSDEQWNSLPAWQRTVSTILNSPTAMGIAQSLPTAIATGTVAGVVATPLAGLTAAAGSVAVGAGLGLAQEQTILGIPNPLRIAGEALVGAENYDKALTDAMYYIFGLPAETIERTIGLGVQAAEPGGIDEIMANLPAAWRAGHFTFETAPVATAIGNIPAALQNVQAALGLGEAAAYAAPGEYWVWDESGRLVPAKRGAWGEELAQNRKQLVEMGATELIESDMPMDQVYLAMNQRYGFTGMASDLLLQTIADLGYEKIRSVGVKGLAKATRDQLLVDASRVAHGRPMETLQMYSILLRQNIAADEWPGQPWYKRWLANVTPEGVSRMLQADEQGRQKLTPVDRMRSAAIAGIPAAMLGFALGGPAGALTGGLLGGFFGNRWSYLGFMTPASRASEVTNNAALTAAIALDMTPDADGMLRAVNVMAKTPAALASELGLKALGSADAAVFPMALSDKVLSVLTADNAVWHASRPSADIIERLATVLSTTADDIIYRLRNTDDAAVLLRQLVERARESGNADIVRAFERGQMGLPGEDSLDAARLAEVAKAFTGDDPAPRTLMELKARMLAHMMDGVQKWAVDTFKVKPDPTWARFGQAIKSAQSAVVLGLNPQFVLRQYFDDYVAMAASGVFGRSADTIAGYFDKFGVVPPRLKSGFGPMALGDTLDWQTIRQATQAKGALADVTKWMGSKDGLGKIAIFSNAAQHVEQVASARATYEGTRKAFNILYRPPKMGDGLRSLLSTVHPELPTRIENAIKTNKLNIAEVENTIFDSFSRRRVDDAIPFLSDAMRKAGVSHASPEWVKDILESTGAMDFLRDRLTQAKDDAGVRQALSDYERQVSQTFTERLQRQLADKVQQTAAQVQTEGLSGVLRHVDDTLLDLAEFTVRHFQEWQNTFGRAEGKSHEERSAIFAARRSESGEAWRRKWATLRAKFFGIAQGLGFESADGQRVVTLLRQLDDNWQSFFKVKDEKMDRFWHTNYDTAEARTAAWNDLQLELMGLYKDASIRENGLYQGVYGVFVDGMGAQFPALLGQAGAWRDQMVDMHRSRGTMMTSFWDYVNTLPGDERGNAWLQFFNQGIAGGPEQLRKPYLTFMRDFFQAQIDGIHNLYGQANGNVAPPAPAVPEMGVRPTEIAQPTPEAPVSPQETPGAARLAQAELPAMPAPETLPKPAQPAYPFDPTEARRVALELGGKDFAGVDEMGNIRPGADAHIVNAVNKYTGTKYANIGEIHPDEVRTAFQTRNVQQRAQMALPIAEAQRAVDDALAGMRFRESDATAAPDVLAEITRLRAENERLSTIWTVKRYDAFKDEVDAAPLKLAVDVQGLKALNDNFSHAAGNALLQGFADAAKRLGLDVYHVSGDEWVIALKTGERLQAGGEQAAAKLRDEFQRAIIIAEKSDGTREYYTGFDIYTGIGDTFETAYNAVNTAKAAYKAAHPEAVRGQLPASVRPTTAAGGEGVGGLPVGPGIPEAGRAVGAERLAFLDDTEDNALGKNISRLKPEAKEAMILGLYMARAEFEIGEPGKKLFNGEDGAFSGVQESSYPSWYQEPNYKQWAALGGREAILDALTLLADEAEGRIPASTLKAVHREMRKKIYGMLQGVVFDYARRNIERVKALQTEWGGELAKIWKELEDPQLSEAWLGERLNRLDEIGAGMPEEARAVLGDRVADAVTEVANLLEYVTSLEERGWVAGRGFAMGEARADQVYLDGVLAYEANRAKVQEWDDTVRDFEQGLLPAGDVRASVESGLRDYFGYEPEQTALTMRLLDARARRWAGLTGRSAGEWWSENIAGVGRGGVGEQALLQTAAARQYPAAPIWYSQLERTVEALPAKFLADDLARLDAKGNIIGGMLNGKGVKADEIVWTGLDTWLTENKGKPVTRADLLQYLQQNRVTVEERVLGGKTYTYGSVPEYERAIMAAERRGNFETAERLTLEMEEFAGLPSDYRPGIPSYAQHVEPGGENYRELLFYSPQAKGFEARHFGTEGTNLLAHARFNDRVDADGKRVLFVEEIQSDWHQAGRERGYVHAATPEDITRLKAEGWHVEATPFDWDKPSADPTNQGFFVQNYLNNPSAKHFRTEQEAWNYLTSKGIPPAPFAKTEAWSGFVLKRMLRWAAENGYDRVAWTTGEMQAKRYPDLIRGVVDNLELRYSTDTTYELTGDKAGKQVVHEVTDAQGLAGMIGKEMTAKLIADLETTGGVARIEGKDFTVGGEGMKGFYDVMLPSVADKLGKRFGAKTGETSIYTNLEGKLVYYILPEGETLANAIHKSYQPEPTYDQAHSVLAMAQKKYPNKTWRIEEYNKSVAAPVHSIDITPALRESVMQGQPLFQPAKAAVEFDGDGRAMVYAMQSPDISSFVHETGHIFRRDFYRTIDQALPQYRTRLQADRVALEGYVADEVARLNGLAEKGELTTALRQAIFGEAERIVGIDEAGQWSRAAEEIFARAFERYLADGAAPSSGLRRVFEAFKRWMLSVYTAIAGSAIDVRMTETLRGVFDRMLAEEGAQAPVAFTRGGQAAMFGAGEDMPLFTGTAQRAAEAPFAPPEQGRTEIMPGFEDVYKPQMKGAVEGGTAEGAGPLFQPAAPVDSDAFRQWFGQSKVVDESGKPLVVYHGTGAEFTEFDRYRLGASTSHPTAKLGFFFTADPSIASLFAPGSQELDFEKMIGYRQYQSGAKIVNVYLSISNPLEVSADDFRRIYVKGQGDTRDLFLRVTEGHHDGIRIIGDERLGDLLGGEEFVADTWVALDSEQIKSVFNRGTFSKTTPNIFEQPAIDPIFARYLDAIARQVKKDTETLEARVTFAKQAITDEKAYDRRVMVYQAIRRAAPDVASLLDQRMATNGVTKWTQAPTGAVRVLYQNDTGNVIYQDGEGTARQMPRDDGERAKAVDNPPGTVDTLMAGAPLNDIEMDGWETWVKPLLSGMEKYLTGPDAVMPETSLGNLNPEATKALRQYLGQVKGSMASAKLGALHWGENRRDASLLNYGRRYGFDNVLQMFFPYEFWYTRSALQWALRAIDRPLWFATYYRLRKMQQDAVDTPGFPTRLKNKFKIELPFIPDWMGGGVYIDPLNLAFPFQQLLRPVTQALQDQGAEEKRAYYLLQGWVADETVDENQAAQAVQTRSGQLWEKALAQAKMELDTESSNPFEYMSTLAGWSIPVTWAYYGLTGQTNKLSALPPTRLINAVTAAIGLNEGRGLLDTDPVRALFGQTGMDEWTDYRIDRELANMTADGLITADIAQIAMIENGQGDPEAAAAYRQAQARVARQGAVRHLFTVLSGDLFPEGEQRQRELKAQFDEAWQRKAAGDKTAISNFFDEHPEYSARLAMTKDPDERLKFYLRSVIWERYTGAPALYKKQIAEQLGDLFQYAFLDPETRNYDEINTVTLTMWANMLGGYTTSAAPEAPEGTITLADPATAKVYQGFVDERNRRYGDEIFDLQEAYYSLPEEQRGEKPAQLQEYEDWKTFFMADHPEVIPYMISEESYLAGATYEVQVQVYQYRAQKLRLFPELREIMDEYYSLPEEARPGWRDANSQRYGVIRAYYDWRDEFMAQWPATIPYIMSEESLAQAVLGGGYGGSGGSSYGYSGGGGYTNATKPPDHLTWSEMNMFSPALNLAMYSYFYGGVPLGSGALRELQRILDASGREIEMDEYLEVIRPSYQ